MRPNCLKFTGEAVEIIVNKGENAGNQHFLLFSQCFPKLSLLETLTWCGKELIPYVGNVQGLLLVCPLLEPTARSISFRGVLIAVVTRSISISFADLYFDDISVGKQPVGLMCI